MDNQPIDTVVWLIVILMTICCLLPLLNTLAISFSNNSAVSANQVGILLAEEKAEEMIVVCNSGEGLPKR